MSEPFVFDPRCDLCKEPFGAVPCGTAVTFHCRPLATEGFSHCALVLSCEFSGTQREQELPLEGPAGERLCFSGTLTAPELPDLLWYHFRFWREDGTGCLLDKTGYRSDGQAVSWQLTVYQESRTPGWFGAGVTYQIFQIVSAVWYPWTLRVWLAGAGSTRTGMTRRSGGRIRMGRSATGTSLVALWRGSRRNWTI